MQGYYGPTIVSGVFGLSTSESQYTCTRDPVASDAGGNSSLTCMAPTFTHQANLIQRAPPGTLTDERVDGPYDKPGEGPCYSGSCSSSP